VIRLGDFSVAQVWYYRQMDETVGPLSPSEFREHATDGRINPDTLVTRDGTDNWVSASRIKGLFATNDDDGYEEVSAVVDEGAQSPSSTSTSRTALSSLYAAWNSVSNGGRKRTLKTEIRDIVGLLVLVATLMFVAWAKDAVQESQEPLNKISSKSQYPSEPSAGVRNLRHYDSDRLFYALGILAANQGDKPNTGSDTHFQKAIRLFSAAISKNPQMAEAYVARGCVHLYFGNRHDLAIADHSKAIELRPGYAEAYLHRADTFYDNGDTEQAVTDCNAALKLSPNLAAAYSLRSRSRAGLGDAPGAKADGVKAKQLGQTPDSPWPYPWILEQGLFANEKHGILMDVGSGWTRMKSVQAGSIVRFVKLDGIERLAAISIMEVPETVLGGMPLSKASSSQLGSTFVRDVKSEYSRATITITDGGTRLIGGRNAKWFGFDWQFPVSHSGLGRIYICRSGNGALLTIRVSMERDNKRFNKMKPEFDKIVDSVRFIAASGVR